MQSQREPSLNRQQVFGSSTQTNKFLRPLFRGRLRSATIAPLSQRSAVRQPAKSIQSVDAGKQRFYPNRSAEGTVCDSPARKCRVGVIDTRSPAGTAPPLT